MKSGSLKKAVYSFLKRSCLENKHLEVILEYNFIFIYTRRRLSRVTTDANLKRKCFRVLGLAEKIASRYPNDVKKTFRHLLLDTPLEDGINSGVTVIAEFS